MPEVKAADYTTGELTSAANVCRDAVGLLTPTAEELMRIAGEVELVEEELHLARTARHLNAAALHLKISEATIRRITGEVSRAYTSVNAWFRWLTLASGLVIIVFALMAFILPKDTAKVLFDFAPLATGLWIGFSAALQILEWRIPRPRRDP